MKNRMMGLLVPAAITLSGACGGEEHTEFLPLQAPAHWVAGSNELVTIGRSEMVPGHDLYNVSGAAWSGDSLLFVADAGHREVRIFDAGGQLVRAYNRRGKGPTDFQFVGNLRPLSDSAIGVVVAPLAYMVFKNATEPRRITRASSFRHTDSRAQLAKLLPNGGFLAENEFLRPQRGTFRPKTQYVIVTPTGQVKDLGWYAGMIHVDDGETTKVLGFSPDIQIAIGPNAIAIAESDELKIDVFDFQGRKVQEISRPVEAVRVTKADKRALRKKYLDIASRIPDSRRAAWERTVRDMPFAETAPLFDQLAYDTEGYLWVREFELRQTPRWFVFDPRGDLLASVETPRFDRIMQITTDRIVARTEDSVGVPAIVTYGITRDPDQAANSQITSTKTRLGGGDERP